MADNPLDDQTKQVADAYWGTSQPAARRDIHGLGEPPRTLTIGMNEYVVRAGASFFGVWVTLAVMFTFGDVISIIATKGFVYPPLASVGFIAASIGSGRRRAALRRRLARVIAEGALTTAVVRNIHQVQTRRYVTTTVTYRVEGAPRDIHLVSRDQAVTFLQVGLRDEVLWLASEPDLVVPTFLVA